LAERIWIELEIDLARQISTDRLRLGNAPIPKNGIKLDPKSLAIASAIIEVLTNGYSFREECFSEIDCIQARKDSSKPEDWKPRSEKFLLGLPVHGEILVLRVGGGYECVLMQ